VKYPVLPVKNKKIKKLKDKKVSIHFLAYVTHRVPMGFLKKVQPKV